MCIRDRGVWNRSFGHPPLNRSLAYLQEFSDVALREDVTAAHWHSLPALANTSREFPFSCEVAVRDRA